MKKLLPLLILLITASNPAHADIIWPSLYITSGMLSIKVIISGLIVELFFVKFFTKINWLKACFITLIANFITCLTGIILIPVSGILIELLTPFVPTFHWLHWILSYLFVVLINTSIEGLIIKLFLKQNFKNIFWWLFIANLLSVLICIIFFGTTMQKIKL